MKIMNYSLGRFLSFVFICILSAFAYGGDDGIPPTSCNEFNFERPGVVNTPQTQSAIATADINRDGIPDVVVTIQELDQISVYLGNNDGTFQLERNAAAGNAPAGIAISDLNLDGELDLAVTNLEQTLTILIGDGAGNFTLTSTISITGVGGAAIKVVSAELNGDGWPDLAVANSSGLRIFIGGPTGFTAGPSYSTPMPATNLAAGDFNADNRADLVVTFSGMSFDGGLRVYINNGQGGFAEGLTVSDSTLMRSAVVRDFTNDGKLDIVAGGVTTSSIIPNKLLILSGNGDGTFQSLPPGNAPTFGEMTSGDFNGDGNLDLATSYGGIYLGNGAGTFTFFDGLYPINFPSGVAAADFTGDGNLDLIQSNGWRSRLYVYPGYGDGRFPAPSRLPSTSSLTRNDSAVADFNADGRLDVVTMEANGTVYLSQQAPDGSFVVVGDGPIYSSGTSTVTLTNTIEVADFNNDGKPDVAFTVSVFNTVRVLLNNGNGTFTAVPVGLGFPSQRPEALRIGDFNNDNNKDIAVLNRDSSNYTIIMGNGAGGFTVRTEQQPILSGTYTFLAVADITLDGKQDMLVSRGNNNLYVFPGIGDGTFGPSQTISSPRPINSITVTDFNSDNLPDIGIASGGFLATYFVRLLNNGHDGFEILEYTAPGISADSIGLVVADFDLDGMKDVIMSGVGLNYNNAGIFRGTGMGNFAPAIPFENLGGKAFSSADFNNDGVPDYAGIGAVYINKARTGPCLSIGDATANEGDTGTANLDFTVNLSAASAGAVTVGYKLVNRSATAGADFDNVSGVVTFEPGMLSRTISIPVRGDLLDEPDEIFNVQLFNSAGASVKDGTGTGTIVDNDAAPSLSISDASFVEGSGGPSNLAFNIALTSASGRLVKVSFATQPGTATTPGDYTALAGVFPIEPGLTSKQVLIPINPDTLVEPDETFTVTLSSPVFVNISDGEATGTIVNDDFGGNVQYSSASYDVAESGGSATITITRANGAASNIVVQYSTSDGTALAGQDYTATSGSVTFGANETSKTFTVPIINDSIDESNIETVNLALTNVTGGATTGEPAVGVLNIQDNDGRAVFDFDGDGKTDIGIFRPDVAEWWINRSSNGETFATQFGSTTDAIVPADYTGDGKSDVAFWRPSSGEWFVLRSEDFSFFAFPFGTAGDIPVPADYDADGKADAAVFRPSTATWFVRRSSDGGTTIVAFGANGDQPVVADYDGDGKADLAIFRPSNGQWWINRSTAGAIATTFGDGLDKPVQGDYTGDGKSDVAFWRPSTGDWFVLRSEDFSFFSFPFGTSGDEPAPGDYDGDGRFDATVFRSSNATWYSNRTSAGTLIQQFGATGDRPIPNAFVPGG